MTKKVRLAYLSLSRRTCHLDLTERFIPPPYHCGDQSPDDYDSIVFSASFAFRLARRPKDKAGVKWPDASSDALLVLHTSRMILRMPSAGSQQRRSPLPSSQMIPTAARAVTLTQKQRTYSACSSSTASDTVKSSRCSAI